MSMVIGHQATATAARQGVGLTTMDLMYKSTGQQWAVVNCRPTANDGEEEVKVNRRMLDKLLALTGVTFTEGCYATLPYTTATSQHQQPTTSDDVNEVKVDHQMLDKSTALTGETFAEGCYATLPNTVMVPQHQQSTVKDDNCDDIPVHGAQRVRHQLLDVDGQSKVSIHDSQLSCPHLWDNCDNKEADNTQVSTRGAQRPSMFSGGSRFAEKIQLRRQSSGVCEEVLDWSKKSGDYTDCLQISAD